MDLNTSEKVLVLLEVRLLLLVYMKYMLSLQEPDVLQARVHFCG